MGEMKTSEIQPFMALALQTQVQAINACENRMAAREVMEKTLGRLAREIRASKQFIGPDLKLVVLPEYVLSGYPAGESIAQWADKACLEMDGDEYQALGQIARDNDIYLAGNAYELDAHFEGLYFQTCFIIAPSGEVILRYRRLNSMFAPTPHDVWDRYLEIYGFEGVFPVVETEIGRLAAMASEEVLYPEIARALVLSGAEILVHPTGEMGMMSETPKAICRKARAVENMCYVVSANSGGIDGHALPRAATDGRSSIIDYQGRTLVESGFGPTMSAHSLIDISALRHARRRPGMGNLLSRQRLEPFAKVYAGESLMPANGLLDANGKVRPADKSRFLKAQKQAIARLIEKGMA